MQKRTAEIQNPHAHLRSLGAFEVLIDAKLAPSESSVRQTLQQSQQQDSETAFIGVKLPGRKLLLSLRAIAREG